MSETVYAVWDGEELSIPYPSSLGTGSQEAAEHVVKPNAHLGYKVVACELVPIEEECPHEWKRRGFLPAFGTMYECAICEGKTP